MAPAASLQASRRPDEDRPCPVCGPGRKDPRNRTRKVMGVWRDGRGQERTWCIRCGNASAGAVQAGGRLPTASRQRRDRAGLANWLWRESKPISGTAGETYFREGRTISCPLPPTVRYLPACGLYSHAVISAFGLIREVSPGQLELPRKVPAVHLTTLSLDGTARLSKKMIGPVSGHPIVLAPPNDGLGLAICEGIEDALSIHEATGLGSWAAGSAPHMAKLAGAVPAGVVVSIIADVDPAGHKAAAALGERLATRGMDVTIRSPGCHA